MATLLRELGNSTIDLTVAAPAAAPVVARAFADPSSLSIPPGALTQGHGYYAAGHPNLRTAVADRLSAQGLATDASQVMITNGAQQALALLVNELVRPGMEIAIEEVSYPGLIDLALRSGARTHYLPVGDDGAQLAALQAACRAGRIGAAFLVTNFQNPTGTVMPVASRRLLVEMAGEEDFVIVDDRTQADLDHGTAPPPPVGSFDQHSRVVTVGAMSKMYWGGLRIGWIRARSSLIDRLLEQKSCSDLGTSMPVQVIAAELLNKHYEATHQWRNRQLRRSLDALESALATLMPMAEWVRPTGGPNLWIRLPGTDALEFSRRALRKGVAVIPGPLLSARPGRATDHIRVPFFADPKVLAEAVTRLAECWANPN
ncbi:MAG: PLP-dependent aminotransferase family protein [Acidimicrobiales bacterium]